MKSLKKYFVYSVALIDLIVVRISLTLAIELRGTESVHGLLWTKQLDEVEFITLLLTALGISALFTSHGLYRIRIMRSIAEQIWIIIVDIMYGVAALSMFAFFVRSQWVIDSRLTLLYFAAICIVLLLLFRAIVVYPIYSIVKRKDLLVRRAILIGDGPIAHTIIDKLENNQFKDIVVVGMLLREHVTSGNMEKAKNPLPVLGSYEDIQSIISTMRIEEAILTIPGTSHDELLQVIDLCTSTPATIVIASPIMEMIYTKIEIESYFDMSVVVLQRSPLKHMYTHIKRGIDIAVASITLVFVSIPMMIIALLLKVTSRDSVIFRQVRIGKDGKEFVMYKFRTMMDNDLSYIEQLHLKHSDRSMIQVGSQKTVSGKTITGIAKFLRKTSLDELPQLLNVLHGEMSLVGPRPGLISEYKYYEQWHKRRLSVLPGCTGLWQVTSRGEGDFLHMVLLDLYYINNASISYDLLLMLKTIPVMIFGKGGK